LVNDNQVAGYDETADMTTGGTTSHPVKQPEDGSQVDGHDVWGGI
jgi:hypothetical protein